MGGTDILLALATVLSLAVGQVLLKLAAGHELSEIFFSWQLWAAGVLYVVTAFIWVLYLRRIDLSRAYPFLALTFVLVPAASVMFLGEKVGITYSFGILLIVAGLVLTALS